MGFGRGWAFGRSCMGWVGWHRGRFRSGERSDVELLHAAGVGLYEALAGCDNLAHQCIDDGVSVRFRGRGPQMVLDWMRPLSVLVERFMAFAPVGGIWDTVRGVAWSSEQPFLGSVAGGRVLAFWPCFLTQEGGVSETASGSGSVLP